MAVKAWIAAPHIDALRKIKDAFVANLTSHGKVDLDAIFANPIYARLIGSFEEINAKFDGRLREIVGGMQDGFRSRGLTSALHNK